MKLIFQTEVAIQYVDKEEDNITDIVTSLNHGFPSLVLSDIPVLYSYYTENAYYLQHHSR